MPFSPSICCASACPGRNLTASFGQWADSKDPDILILHYTEDSRAKEDKVFDRPELMKAPIVRNGKQATVGFAPEVWETWK